MRDTQVKGMTYTLGNIKTVKILCISTGTMYADT